MVMEKEKTYEDGIMDAVNLLESVIGPMLDPPVRILKNGPATILFWKTGDKTIVKCAKGTTPDDYSAFCAAFTKHFFGSNSRIRKIMRTRTVVQEAKPETAEKAVEPEKAEEPEKAAEPEKPKAPKKKGPARTPLDIGKVHALRNAGWKLQDIADEMGVTITTIRRRLDEDEEKKKDQA